MRSLSVGGDTFVKVMCILMLDMDVMVEEVTNNTVVLL